MAGTGFAGSGRSPMPASPRTLAPRETLTARPSTTQGRGATGSARKPLPFDRTPLASHGRVARILVGQGFGYIRLSSDRDVFFHKSDILDGVTLRDLQVGDVVDFDLIDDPVSGPRGQRVARALRKTAPRR